MELLKSMGLNPENISEETMEKLERVARKLNSNNLNPQQVFSLMAEEGLDPQSLVKQMRGKVEQKVSVRIGRNEKCVCGSGKKYKKCCGKN